MDEKFLNFNQLKSKVIESKNKVAFLVQCFKVLHDNTLPEEIKNSGGRLAGILKQANNDYVRVLQAMWMASACGIQGSHLNYIQKMIMNKGVNKNPQRISSFDKIDVIKSGDENND